MDMSSNILKLILAKILAKGKEPKTTINFITELFCRVDDQITAAKHSQGKLYPSEVVTLALLYSLKGCGQRAFWRWLVRDYRSFFPQLPLSLPISGRKKR